MRRPSSTALIIGAAVTQLALYAAVFAMAGVSWIAPPSPVTTVTDGSGQEIVLNWADYPADPNLDPGDVLAAPRAEDVPGVGETELERLRSAVDAVTPSLKWAPQGTGTNDSLLDSTIGGNGYGGPSLHRIYNSPDLAGGGLTAETDWSVVSAAINTELTELGYTPVVWDFDRPAYTHQTRSERDAEIIDQYGSLDPDRMWLWSGIAERDSMWVAVTIWDERRGGAKEYWPDVPSGVGLFIGGTVIATSDEEAYVAGVAPFTGLQRPQSTGSD